MKKVNHHLLKIGRSLKLIAGAILLMVIIVWLVQ